LGFNFSRKKIRSEKTMGQIFQAARKKRRINLEQVESETKVSMKYLQAIEHNDFKILPADVYVIRYIERYANFIGLNPKKMVERYKHEAKIYKEFGIFKIEQKEKKSVIKPLASKKWLNTPSFIVTPKLVVGTIVVLIVVGILSYILYQVKSFAAAPPLNIESPRTEEVIKSDRVKVIGNTDLGAEIAINNEFVPTGNDGHFESDIKLEPGINTLEIISKNKNSKVTRRIMRVFAEYNKN